MKMRTRDSTRPVLLGCAVLFACSHLMAQQASSTEAQDSTYTIKSHVNVALVPVLVRDRRGQEVGNLKREDFQIFDNGKPRDISGFTIQKRAGVEKSSQATPSTPSGVTHQVAIVPNRFVVFLFDDMHTRFEDLAQVQKATAKILATSLTDTDMAAVVSLSGRLNSGLTFDHVKLQETVMQVKPQGLYRKTGSECPDIDYYQADLIQNKHDSNALQAAIEEVLSCSPGLKMRDVAERLAEGTASQVLSMGDQDVQVSLTSILGFVRRMASLPGQRTLILVSPGFFTLTAQALAWESQIMDAAAQANVIISALDARGLYTTEIDASERGGGSAFSSRLRSEYHRESMSLSENVMAELADGTGGTYFHNSNDLEGGFQRVTTAPEFMYLLEISLQDVKADGRYHDLKVKVDDKDLKLQARRGYFAPKAPKKKS